MIRRDMRNELFVRAERACAETHRLIAEAVIGVDQTLRVLHRCAIRQEDTWEVLERATQCLKKAGRDSACERFADTARKPGLRVCTRDERARNVNDTRTSVKTGLLDLLLELALLRDRADQACRESQALRKYYRGTISWTHQTIRASSQVRALAKTGTRVATQILSETKFGRET